MPILAPYGKHLQALADPPLYLFIFMGKFAWDRAKNFHSHFPATLVLPLHESPFNYIWPVTKHDIIILDTGITNLPVVREFAICLFSHEANSVKYLSKNVAMTQFEYKKELNNEKI